MLQLSHRALRRVTSVLALLLCVSFLVPSASLAQSGGGAGSTGAAITVAPLNMRSGPATTEPIVAIIPSGTTVAVTGGAESGFLPVSWNGSEGWASADYLSFTGSGEESAPSETGDAQTVSPLNMRSGPGTDYGVITVLPGGVAVTLTGESSNGFVSISYDGMDGWVSADYVTTGTAAPAPEPEPAPATDAPVTSTLVSTSDLNLRSAPDLSASVLTVIPVGAKVGITGTADNGFYPVNYDGLSGWASAEFLQDGSASALDPGAGGSGLIWPVSGGEWSIIQGYNGGTHQNRSASAQYYYALDIARTDGATAGQAVYAPASGAILWLDPGSGGIAIDMGNGYTVAMFHVTFDGSLGSGQSVSQGQYLGTIPGPGGAGYASTPHVDITLWQTANGGRAAAPFSGGNGISGMDFPDVGGGNQHGGTTLLSLNARPAGCASRCSQTYRLTNP